MPIAQPLAPLRNSRWTGLHRLIGLSDQALGWIDRVLMFFVCLAMITIMVLVFLDAVARYSLNKPLEFTLDLVTQYLLSAAMLLGLSFTLRRSGHISVDLFANMMPKRLYHLIIGIALIAGAFVVGLMSWQTWSLTHESWEQDEVMTGIYAWPLWLGKAIVSTSVFVLALRLLQVGIANLLAGLLNAADLAIPIAPAHDSPSEEGV